MTNPRDNLWPFRCPAKMGAVLLALSAGAGPASASAPAPLSPSIGSQGGVTAVLFKYEDLFGRSAGRPKSFKRIDIDGNQALSPEELQRAFGSRWQSVFTSLDRNNDGRVTREEVPSSGDSVSERSNSREEPSSGARSDHTTGTRSNSQGAESARSNSGKGSESREGAGNRGDKASGSERSRGHGEGSGKADERGGAADKGGGNGSKSDGNRGRN